MLRNKSHKLKPCIIGLGYVGLPILLNLSKKYNTSGYDISKKRILELKRGIDIFGEFSKNQIKKDINFQSNIKNISSNNIFIITVPTPILNNKKPDLSHLKNVCNNISKILKKKMLLFLSQLFIQGLQRIFVYLL